LATDFSGYALTMIHRHIKFEVAHHFGGPVSLCDGCSHYYGRRRRAAVRGENTVKIVQCCTASVSANALIATSSPLGPHAHVPRPLSCLVLL